MYVLLSRKMLFQYNPQLSRLRQVTWPIAAPCRSPTISPTIERLSNISAALTDYTESHRLYLLTDYTELHRLYLTDYMESHRLYLLTDNAE